MLEVAATFLSDVWDIMPLGNWAEWFSGVMSMLAVFVALFLASTARKTKVTGFCHNRLVSHPSEGEPQVTVTANNVGHRTVTINGIQIRRKQNKFARKGNRVALHLKRAKHARIPDDLPKTLAEGESATWHFSEDEVVLHMIHRKMVQTKKDAHALQCVFITNLGKNFTIKLDAGLIQSFIDRLEDFG